MDVRHQGCPHDTFRYVSECSQNVFKNSPKTVDMHSKTAEMYSKNCILNTFKQLKCIQNKVKCIIKYSENVFKLQPKCAQNAVKMYSK